MAGFTGLQLIFGEAPVAVKEAKRQFDNSLKVMEDGIHIDSCGDCSYLLSSGFSAVDILLVDCCSWAKHIGWLVKNDGSNNDDVVHELKFPRINNHALDNHKEIRPTVMSRKLEKYVEMCRSRPAYKQANQLRNDQVTKDPRRTSKL